MTLRGEGARRISIALQASFIGAIISIVCLIQPCAGYWHGCADVRRRARYFWRPCWRAGYWSLVVAIAAKPRLRRRWPSGYLHRATIGLEPREIHQTLHLRSKLAGLRVDFFGGNLWLVLGLLTRSVRRSILMQGDAFENPPCGRMGGGMFQGLRDGARHPRCHRGVPRALALSWDYTGCGEIHLASFCAYTYAQKTSKGPTISAKFRSRG